MNERISKIKDELEKHLDAPRMEHTLGVMYTAASLAMRYGAEVNNALIAGLLHDCAKCIPSDKKIHLCHEYGVEVSTIEYQNPGLLHAKLGAVFAKEFYGIEDTEILNAIIWHTTGRPKMSLLDKIIYIADYIEPGRRELPNMADVRRLAFDNIDECLYKILNDSLIYLASRDMPIDPMTEETFIFYKNYLSKEAF